jgi:phosphonoacetaldehyde hydrolase
MTRKIACVIFDWAGTTVDFGSLAPVDVFLRLFADEGIPVFREEARLPMGLPKKDHLREILRQERVSRLWRTRFGAAWTETDVERLYTAFEPALLSILRNHADPIEGVREAVSNLRGRGIRIGSTTGYTRRMMDVLAPLAAERGYSPDALVTPDDVSSGRPAPFMCYRNAIELGVYPMSDMVKVGDTIADISEGKNAGMISVGVVIGSNEMGLSREEADAFSSASFSERVERVRRRFFEAGADYVIGSMAELPGLIDRIEGE